MPEPLEERTATWAAIIASRMPRDATQRVKAGRRLRTTGAVAVRPGVYAMPDSDAGRATLADAAREVSRQRGSARPCLLTWLDPHDESELRRRYERDHARRGKRLSQHIRALERSLSGGSRLRAASRQTAHARLARLRKQLERTSRDPSTPRTTPSEDVRSHRRILTSGVAPDQGRTWVTRRGVLVDRIASAWFIRRFIDHEAQFRFVTPSEPLNPGELRFDMAEADFGHEGERCTFETLVERFRGHDPALRQLAEIIHDLDLQDGKHARTEAPGVALMIAGIAASEPDDSARIQQGHALFDLLYLALRPKPTPHIRKGALP